MSKSLRMAESELGEVKRINSREVRERNGEGEVEEMREENSRLREEI